MKPTRDWMESLRLMLNRLHPAESQIHTADDFVRLAEAGYDGPGSDRARYIKYIKCALKLAPLHSGANLAMAEVYIEQADFENALPHMQRVVDAEPDEHGPRARLGYIYQRIGALVRALAEYKEAATISGKYRQRPGFYAATSGDRSGLLEAPGPWFNLGDLYRKMNRHSEAAEAYRKLMSMFEEVGGFGDDRYHMAALAYGSEMRTLDRPAEAVQAWQRVLDSPAANEYDRVEARSLIASVGTAPNS